MIDFRHGASHSLHIAGRPQGPTAASETGLHTRLLMGLSAAFMAAAGLVFSFLPAESLVVAGVEPARVLVVFVQVTGALYLGFAMLNWSARGVMIGGIYARPVGLGNVLHFAVVAATLVKAASVNATLTMVLLAAIYTVFGVWFGLVVFTSPVGPASQGKRQ